ncbi:hypothetical protein GJ744_005835 [Endocarpon pusillum]|uniref:Uncharacterized protein n=1 Tax=Endocarpon pusillum TaxID=364733 RepID=A0A8H7A894_9EURO|nr:hypothetical protein GJ744_005835 [Endocarpon pusillum]
MGAEAIQQLAETTAAVATRKKRQSAPGRRLQKGGVLYSQEARSMRQEREIEEEQKKEDREDRQMSAYIRRLPEEQRTAFLHEMEGDNLERATRLQARLTQRRQQAAQRRAERRARNREAAQREA